jgi:phosphoglycolate phosphatase
MTLTRAVLFDLDGTLIDSVPDITEAVAELMGSEGLAAHDEAAVRRMVGHGVEKLVERAFAAHGRALEPGGLVAMTARMMTIYPRHLVAKTRLMPGVEQALDRLAGMALAVVTNKPEGPTRSILQHFALLDRFALVLGDRGPGRLIKKPAPDMLLYAATALGSSAADTVMVGDSGADILAARAARMRSVAVRGGYHAEPLETYAPDLVIDTLEQLDLMGVGTSAA